MEQTMREKNVAPHGHGPSRIQGPTTSLHCWRRSRGDRAFVPGGAAVVIPPRGGVPPELLPQRRPTSPPSAPLLGAAPPWRPSTAAAKPVVAASRRRYRCRVSCRRACSVCDGAPCASVLCERFAA